MTSKRFLASSTLATFVLLLVVLFPLVVYGASSGPNSPVTCISENFTGATDAWSAPGRATTSDDSQAVVSSLTGTDQSRYLKCTNFGFSIPTDATINGIIVEFEIRSGSSASEVQDNRVRIVKSDGTVGSTDKSVAGAWPTTDTYASYGSSSDLWGETWTYTDINDVDFGAALSAKRFDTIGTALVDHVRITVYYTESGGSPPVEESQVKVISIF